MLRVRFPSLTPIFIFSLFLFLEKYGFVAQTDLERKFPKLEVARSNRAKAFQKFRRVVSIGKTSVSKTEVFSSNLSAPANFPPARQNVIANPHTSPLDFGFAILDFGLMSNRI